ncbi:MAG: hypothetical protein HN356_13650 [Calditrichaeota bacterium]|nr:hypothetical protein [Calditrichota bacterium]
MSPNPKSFTPPKQNAPETLTTKSLNNLTNRFQTFTLPPYEVNNNAG